MASQLILLNELHLLIKWIIEKNQGKFKRLLPECRIKNGELRIENL